MMFSRLRALLPSRGHDDENQISATETLARADAARDAGNFELAADLYSKASTIAPTRRDILIQLGNMQKDRGRPRAALKTYERALNAGFHRADVWVQISRCHYMLGDTTEAIRASETALEFEPQNEDARTFLIERGRAALQTDRIAAIEAGAHPEPLIALAEEVERLAHAIRQIQRELPSRAQFAYTPHRDYDGFRKRFTLPHPPEAPEPLELGIIFDCEAATASDLRRFRASLEGQTSNAWRLYLLGGENDPEVETLVVADAKTSFLAWAEEVPNDCSILFVCGAAILAADAINWIAFARSLSSSHLIQIDEVEVEQRAGEEERHLPPHLFGQPDFDYVCETGTYPTALLWPENGIDKNPPKRDWRTKYLSALRSGSVAYLPLPLVQTPKKIKGNDPKHLERVQGLLKDEAHVEDGERHLTRIVWAAPAQTIIDVIIPTKDNSNLLEPFVASLLEKSTDSSSIRVSIIDNNSSTEKAAEAHERLSAMSNIEVVRETGPFNWSKMNNDAVDRTAGDILVFANDDMEMLTEGWDIETRSLLSRDKIGVLGAMLLYPTGEIQHAGVMMGWRGGAIHEGLAWDGDDLGPGKRWATRHCVSAVTGAFLATTRSLFSDLGGFDQILLPIGGSDLDFSLKARAVGKDVMWTPHIRMTHYESLSRGLDHADEKKERRNHDETAVLRSRWGKALSWDTNVHPLWADFGRPFQHIIPINQGKVIAHLRNRTRSPFSKIDEI